MAARAGRVFSTCDAVSPVAAQGQLGLGGAYYAGFTGRPANGHGSFSTMVDISADYAVSSQLSLSAYYAHVNGKA